MIKNPIPVFVRKLAVVLFVAFIFFGFSTKVHAAACGSGPFYVSSSTGSDSNNGTSPSTPWAHHPWDSNRTGNAACTLAPGNTVYMYGGDTWYNGNFTTAQSGTSGNPITTTTLPGFGSATLPVISAGKLLNGTWTFVSGTTYSIALTSQTNMVYNGSVKLTLGTGSGSLTSGQWYWASSVLYVNIGSNPTGGTIVASQNNYAIDVVNDYTVFNGIAAQMSNFTVAGANIFVNGEIHTQILNSNFSRSLVYGVYWFNTNDSGGSPTDSLISNNTIDATDIAGAGIAINAANTGTVSNNTITNSATSGTGEKGIYLKAVSSNWQIFGNTSNGGLEGIDLENSNSNNVYQNIVENNGYGSYPSTSTGDGILLKFSDSSNRVYQNDIEGNTRGVSLSLNGGTGDNWIYDNKVLNDHINDIDNQSSIAPSALPTLIFNNTVRHNPALDDSAGYTGHGIDVQGTGTNTVIENNTISIWCLLSDNCQGIAIAGTYANIALDNNNYFQAVAGATVGQDNGFEYTNLFNWLTAISSDSGITTKDTHSLSTDPLFVSSSNYNLTASSPLIDAGTAFAGVTTDILGNPIYGNPDIGGYEYQPPHNMATADTVDIGAGARIYGDGKFRDLGTTSGSAAHLKIAPQGGTFTTYSSTAARPAWLDVTSITNWTSSHKTWTESNAQSSNMVTDHTVGDLVANANYTITVTGATSANISGINGTTCVNAVCESNSSGVLSFEYNGGYSTHTFDMQQNTYTVGGTITGLSGTVVLQNNAGDNLSLSTNTSFHFLTPLNDAATYAVTVLTQPAFQTCSVSNGSGTLSGANASNVSIACTNNGSTVGVVSGGKSFLPLPFITPTSTTASPATAPLSIATVPSPLTSKPAVYDFGTTTLKLGSTGKYVKALQHYLNDTLHLNLAIDGKLGPKTIVVIKQWQKAHHLTSDGLVGSHTKALMNS
jgi:parallel beta-helix repeat protein